MNQKVAPKCIVEYILHNPGSNAKKISDHFAINIRTVYYILGDLISSKQIIKKGTTPRVHYYIYENDDIDYDLGYNIIRDLDQEWYQISKTGKELVGVRGFADWCGERSQDIKTASLRREGHIDYLDKIRTRYGISAIRKLDDYENNKLEDLWYGNIYALPEFGKTKYGTWMEIAKTYPSNKIFGMLLKSVEYCLKNIIEDKGIDAICFVRPTAKRSLQIMDYLSKNIYTNLPRVQIEKVPGFFPAQKTLKNRQDRIANAQASFEILDKNKKYNYVLIVDDAVGSGATLTEIGNKIIENNIAPKVAGFSIVGTANGIFDQVSRFEVLSSV